MEVTERIYEEFAGDRTNTFFSIVVWQMGLRPFEDSSWDAYFYVLEARYVIFGRTLHYVADFGAADQASDERKRLLGKAKKLSAKWTPEFMRFQKMYNDFRTANPEAGVSWNKLFKRLVKR